MSNPSKNRNNQIPDPTHKIRKVKQAEFDPGLGISSGGWYDEDSMKSSSAVMQSHAERMLQASRRQTKWDSKWTSAWKEEEKTETTTEDEFAPIRPKTTGELYR